MEKERNVGIDFLKSIGILLLILAHTCSSEVILQIRNFDVILIVLISAMLSVNSYKKEKNYFAYVKKRIVRLIVPTYLFLTLFFTLTFVVSTILKRQYPFDIRKIFDSFLLTNGIGYVWIIRVYIVTAFITPLLIQLKEKLRTLLFWLIIATIYIFYEVLYIKIGNANFILQYIIYYIIPFSLIISLGLELKNMTNKNKNILITVSLIIFTVCAIVLGILNGKFVYTQEYKYPPRLYYISYSIGISVLLIKYLYYVKIKNEKIKKCTIFISKHSLWIYLWHILPLYTLNWLGLNNINDVIKYIFVFFVAMIITYLQNKIVDKIDKNDSKFWNLLRY